MTVTERIIARIEEIDTDRLSKPLQTWASRLVEPRLVRNVLSGTYLGHPLHPMLTDVPIGAWLSSAVLDHVGGPATDKAADVLIGTGIAAAVPTALSGLNDWSDSYGPETRVGFAHAAGNTIALGLYTASLAARLAGKRSTGRTLARLGLATMTASGYLGGHMSFVKGMMVNHLAFEHPPTQWTAVAADGELGEGATLKADAAGATVLLYRSHGQIYAVAGTCTHAGGPVAEGKVDNDCVTCPWHGASFALADGKVVRGPASTPLTSYQTRVNDGQIEVRAAH